MASAPSFRRNNTHPRAFFQRLEALLARMDDAEQMDAVESQVRVDSPAVRALARSSPSSTLCSEALPTQRRSVKRLYNACRSLPDVCEAADDSSEGVCPLCPALNSAVAHSTRRKFKRIRTMATQRNTPEQGKLRDLPAAATARIKAQLAVIVEPQRVCPPSPDLELDADDDGHVSPVFDGEGELSLVLCDE
jgi:hypothetical protein